MASRGKSAACLDSFFGNCDSELENYFSGPVEKCQISHLPVMMRPSSKQWCGSRYVRRHAGSDARRYNRLQEYAEDAEHTSVRT